MIDMTKLNDLCDFILKIVNVTPAVITDLKKLVDAVQKPLAGDTPMPTNVQELSDAMIEGNRRVQAQRDFIVNQKAKRLSNAITMEMTESLQPSLTGVLARL